ncbi:MAG: hypothetical protein K8I27_13095 [Planctomycetes bacterium]|nr:hypothetical protein [Planctomycetota bacterium]
MSHLDYAARTFGLDPRAIVHPPQAVSLPLPEPGETLAVIGPSGAGKTLALRACMNAHNGLELPTLSDEQLDSPVLALFGTQLPGERVLRNLARMGLADGRLWRMRARDLSAGEYRRLQLALALVAESPSRLLMIDELDAHLDAVTARVIARNLCRMVRRSALRLVVSTHRPEILPDLQPARVLRIDDGIASDLPAPPPLEIADEIEFARGRVRDYARFATWHYLGGGRPGPTSDVFLALHERRAIGIAMFGYPHLLLGARNTALPEFAPGRIRAGGAGGLNANVRLLQRVVIEPRFRGIGAASRLIRYGLENISAPIVECVAQMGAFSDFLLAAGFVRAGEVKAPPSVRGLRAFLRRHGIGHEALLREDLSDRLAPELVAELERHIRNVVRTRIQTGFGSRRKGGGLPDGAARKALARVGATPGYFLWRRAP